MITISQALDWLNQLDPSHLSPKSRFVIWQVTTASIPESEKASLMNTLIASAKDSDEPNEYAEVLANCARIEADRNHQAQALGHLESAAKIYKQNGDRIRQAVVLWMKSTVEWTMLDNLNAHAHAREARGLLEKLASEMLLDEKDNRGWWVQDRIADMDEALFATPEEAYFWLNQFEGSHLKAPAIQVVDAIRAAMRNKQFSRVYQLVASLTEITRNSGDTGETAEALTYCGLVNAQMGNTRDATRLLRQASALFQPESHHQTAVRWMLGMVLFTQPSEFSQAVTLCNQCIASMDQLKSRVVQRNRPQEQTWYERQAGLMRKILSKKIKT